MWERPLHTVTDLLIHSNQSTLSANIYCAIYSYNLFFFFKCVFGCLFYVRILQNDMWYIGYIQKRIFGWSHLQFLQLSISAYWVLTIFIFLLFMLGTTRAEASCVFFYYPGQMDNCLPPWDLPRHLHCKVPLGFINEPFKELRRTMCKAKVHLKMKAIIIFIALISILQCLPSPRRDSHIRAAFRQLFQYASYHRHISCN